MGWDAVPSESENLAGPLPSHAEQSPNSIVTGGSVVLSHQSSYESFYKGRTNMLEGVSSWVTQQAQSFAPLKLYSATAALRAPQKHHKE